MSYNNHKKYALFIGRWQPFHNGHKFLIDKALSEGKKVCVAIRDTELSRSNPYTYEQRAEMIKHAYRSKCIELKIIRIPDIESVNIGRNVGYDINIIEPTEEIGKISGTSVREGKETSLPEEVAEYLGLLKTTIWFTGLPCSGKTTLARALKEELDNKGYRIVHLDAEDIRKRLNEDLGFSEKDRYENLRRIAHVAQLFNENHNTVITSFITPTNKMREMVGGIISNMKLVYIKCGLKTCEKRDIKGMYKAARLEEIKDFTGISAPFEEPDADIIVDTEKSNLEECIKKILEELRF